MAQMRQDAINDAWITAECSVLVDCGDILEAFLHDMRVLDHQQLRPTAETKKRGLTQVAPGQKTLATTVTTTAKKKRLNPSWLKRKRELAALREQTQALEIRVEFLRAKHATTEISVETAETRKQRGKQREACLIEKQRFQDSQDENEYLKNRLRAYVNLSGHLQTVLTAAEQQRNELMVMSMAAASTLRIENGAGLQLRLASPSVFDMLENE